MAAPLGPGTTGGLGPDPAFPPAPPGMGAAGSTLGLVVEEAAPAGERLLLETTVAVGIAGAAPKLPGFLILASMMEFSQLGPASSMLLGES